MHDTELLYEVLVLMVGRRPVVARDVVFVFGRAEGDWEEDSYNQGLLEIAADLYVSELVRAIAVPGYEGTYTDDGVRVPTGYPGGQMWRDYLSRRFGISENFTLPVPGGGSNTKTEGDDFIRFAQSKGWTSAVVVMQPHQVLRAMLGLVKSFDQLGHWMSVVPVVPVMVQWQKSVSGSQGQGGFERYKHIAWERERIPRYQAKGDLATLEELRQYLIDTLE